MAKIRWGILSTAKIGVKKVIPAMQNGQFCQIDAIASRSLENAQKLARDLNIPKAYGSYEELLHDPDIDAIYNPLPNHLHVPWSIKALQAAKHVLCEKPIALSAAEGQKLVDFAKTKSNLKIMEAFMYRFHPQWQRTKKLLDRGDIGQVRIIQSFFSYDNKDPHNIRNIAEYGGGGLMDIGCYCISLARFIAGEMPIRIIGIIEYDPEFKVDRLASGILDFGTITSTFTCATQLTNYQRVHIYGTQGRIEIEVPFNAPPDKPCRIWHQKGSKINQIEFEICDQYTLQGDLFSKAIIQNQDVPTPLEDAVENMKVIEAIVKSSRKNNWIKIY
jgi:predicted dehydrogenase